MSDAVYTECGRDVCDPCSYAEEVVVAETIQSEVVEEIVEVECQGSSYYYDESFRASLAVSFLHAKS